MVVAVVGAASLRAVGAGETRVANALSVDAPPVVVAVSGTVGLTAVRTAETGEADALSVHAAPLIAALVGTLVRLWFDGATCT